VELDVTKPEQASGFALLAAVSMNPAFQFILNNVLGLIAQLVYVSHLCVLDLNYSLNLQAFFKSIFPILIFDVVPADDIFEYSLSLSEVEEDDHGMNDKFKEIGYESIMIFGNLGSLLIF
jgi:hypothetical protein